MKNNVLRLILLIAALSSLVKAGCCPNQKLCCNGVTTSNNTFIPRSFAASSSREILMTKSMYDEHRELHRDSWHGTFTTATEYSATIHRCDASENLGTRPFWSGRNTMTYGTNDGNSDVDAYQFGMGNIASQGVIKLDPHVQQAGVDMMLHVVQHLDRPSFYFKIHAPLVGLMINPYLSEPVEAYANETADANQWDKYPGPKDRPRTLAEAFAGGRCDSEDFSAAGNPFRAMFGRKMVLEKGQISVRKETVVRIADLSVTVGANLARCDKGMWGIGFKFAAPTGNVADCHEILEPIVGHGGHWAIGLESFGYYQMHEGVDSSLTVRYQGELNHLKQGRTAYRSFDLLQNGPGSKYLLLEYYQQSATTGLFTPPGFITQAINLTTLPVKSTFNFEGSFAVMVDGSKGNWEYGAGGEIWGRSCEKIAVDCGAAIKDHFTGEFNDFAVLGRQRSGASGAIPNRCEPLARINKSEDFDSAPLAAETDKIKDATLSVNRIPKEICNALDIGSATARRAVTAKLFGNLGYCWKEHYLKPHVSLYGSTEFSAGSDNNAMNMWTMGVQGSLHF